MPPNSPCKERFENCCRTKLLKRTQRTMQAVRKTALPKAWYSLVKHIDADGDSFNALKSNMRGIATGEIPEGLTGVLRAWHACMERERTGTWETP